MKLLTAAVIVSAVLALILLSAGCAGNTGTIAVAPSGEPEAPLANDGYDMTAYFSLGKAVRGTPQLSFVWNGANYLFSSEEHRDRFAAAPEMYTPGLDAHCPVSLADGKEIDGDPSVWRIFKDRLYFFTSEDAAKRFDREPEAVLTKAKESRK